MTAPKSPRFLSSELLVDNPWHRYRRDRFRQRDGSLGEYFYVDMTGACGIVPLFEDGSTLLLRVYRYLLDETLWEFPMGGVQPGEDPLAFLEQALVGVEAGATIPDPVLGGRMS